MKKSDNFEESIHNEAYYAKCDTRSLNHSTMIFNGGRQTEKLNGLWNYVMDQYDVGLRDNWHVPRKIDEKGVQEPWDYHVDDGELTFIPCCWNTIKPEFFWFEGCGWFSRHFRYIKQDPSERVFLHVGGANYDAKVYLNYKFLGNHVGGSTPFFVELTDDIQQENVIQVCVNNTRTSDRVPMKNTDWFNWGGLYRDIELIRVPRDFIRDFRVHLVPDGRFDKIEVAIKVSDTSARDTVRLTMPELGIDRELKLSDGECREVIKVSPELWSPSNPKLYDVSAAFRGDTVCDRIGFREIRVKGTDIFLNGKKIWLKGISVHEDDADLGKVSSAEDIHRRYAHAKELGCNYLRLSHYPHNELAAKIADEEGLLLWEEIPVYWAIDFTRQAVYEDAQNQLLELINRDYNRASVIIWAVGNENADTDERLDFMSRLAKTAKSHDSSRLVTAACLVNHAKNRIEDRLTEYLDIIGLNEYYGWYKTRFEDLIELGENSKPDKPVLITEFGAGAKAGHHGSISEKFTEEYAQEVYRRQIETIERLDYVKGMSPWILYDFTCPRRNNRYQRGYNRKGLIAEDKKTRKLPFFVLQEFYRRK
ncbi:glycoside hydrolase family 2 TIM barrel-domain containing protein [Marispirochaeta aestuarii]|uniref:glycoside hydrolase family 2 protein n=1 Tax=Marispirochaeta aestuarii TaxID=1963862 RepID=UPI0029C6540A|nr:glycoside hydrolase family 2 TIM barrel-domain containing protein [Marispirochaeta aestuarii]